MADSDMVILYDDEGNRYQVPAHMAGQFRAMSSKMRARFPGLGDVDPTTGNAPANPNYPRKMGDEEFQNKLWPSPTPMGRVPTDDGMGETKTVRGPANKAEEAYQKLRTRRGGPQ